MGKVSQHPEQKVCLSISVLFQKKQTGWLRKCLCKYSTEVSRFALEILKKSKVKASKSHLLWPLIFPPQCVTPLENLKAKKRTPKLFDVFVDHLCKLTALLIYLASFANLLHEISHAITFTCNQPCLQTYCLGFFTEIVWFRRMFGLWWVVNDNWRWQQNF